MAGMLWHRIEDSLIDELYWHDDEETIKMYITQFRR